MSSLPSSAGPGRRGLQVERTRLAWRRTTLVATTVALLGLSQAISGALQPAAAIGLALVAAAWLAILGVAQRRLRALAHYSTMDSVNVDTDTTDGAAGSRSAVRSGPPPPGRAPGALALLAAAVALASLLLLA